MFIELDLGTTEQGFICSKVWFHRNAEKLADFMILNNINLL